MIKRTLFFGSKCRLSTRYDQIVIKTVDTDTTVPIEDIGFVVIENQESHLSIPLLTKLVENNVAVIFCDSKHMPRSMLLNLESHHLQQEIFRNQINVKEPLKKRLWQQIVKIKIKNQDILLKNLGNKNTPLEYYASKVLSGDTDNREGSAAAYYWKNLFDFSFKRERFGSFPNLFLNYGYTILRAAVARSLSGSGLLTTLGINHHNKYNSFCLADDIMEPYRPLVDAKVLEIIKSHKEKELTTSIKSKLLEILTETVYFKDKKSPLMIALTTTSASLQSCFMGRTRKIIYPKLWF